MKIFCFIGAVMFSFFSYWQLNDLGQYGTAWWQGWLLTYLCSAVICAVSFFKVLPRITYWIGAALALIHALLRSLSIQPAETILYNADNPAGNETGGLLIVCIWFITLALWKKPSSSI